MLRLRRNGVGVFEYLRPSLGVLLCLAISQVIAMSSRGFQDLVQFVPAKVSNPNRYTLVTDLSLAELNQGGQCVIILAALQRL